MLHHMHAVNDCIIRDACCRWQVQRSLTRYEKESLT